MKKLDVIGRAELIDFPDLDLREVPAKIDTGADVSSIWCSHAKITDGNLECVFFGPESEFYTGKKYLFPNKEYAITRVANSFGHKEVRYKLKIPVRISGRRIKATFTLADRSQKLYPVLVGNRTLRGKFLVDASIASPLRDQEKERKLNLESELKGIEEIE